MIADRTKIFRDWCQEIGVGESIGDVISGLRAPSGRIRVATVMRKQKALKITSKQLEIESRYVEHS